MPVPVPRFFACGTTWLDVVDHRLQLCWTTGVQRTIVFTAALHKVGEGEDRVHFVG